MFADIDSMNIPNLAQCIWCNWSPLCTFVHDQFSSMGATSETKCGFLKNSARSSDADGCQVLTCRKLSASAFKAFARVHAENNAEMV